MVNSIATLPFVRTLDIVECIPQPSLDAKLVRELCVGLAPRHFCCQPDELPGLVASRSSCGPLWRRRRRRIGRRSTTGRSHANVASMRVDSR